MTRPSDPMTTDQGPMQGAGSGECDHRFVYSGFRYAHGTNSRPGSGAVNVYYGHAFFCERCLAVRVEPTAAGDRNSYQPALPDSAPATEAERELLVPAHDRNGRRW